MKKLLGILPVLVAVMATAAIAQPVGEFSIPSGPMGPGNSGPDVFLSYRAVDLGLDVDGSGSSINPTDIRPGFYAFTGERIFYIVVVRDQNGAQDINLVKWVKDSYDEMGPCTDETMYVVDATNSQVDTWNAGYCMSPCGLLENGVVEVNPDTQKGHIVCPEGSYKVEIDTSTNLQWDPQLDKLYKCVLTVESQWYGSEIQVVAEDTDGMSGATLAENWDFNPPLMVDVDTSDGEPLAFGEVILDQDVPFATAPNCVIDIGENLAPDCDGTEGSNCQGVSGRDCDDYIPDNMDEPQKKCDISFSTNKIVVENIGPPVTLWSFIAATNFYASDGLAKCPFTNELDANQFEYRAMTGSWDSGWRVMPQYAPNMECSGPFLWDTCRGACRISTGCPFDVLPPFNHIEIALKIVWPTPCIGTFDTGDILVIVRAV
jgi:hypothetical protein